MAFKSWVEVANEVGVDVRSLYRLKRREDWPASVPRKFPKAGISSEQVQVIRDWRSTFSGPNTPTSDTKEKLQGMQVKLARERLRHLELKRELDEGNYVSRDLLDGALGGLAKVFIAAVEELELGLPARLEGKNAAEIEKALARWADTTRKRICDAGEFELLKLTEAIDDLRRPKRGRPGLR